MQTIPNLLDYIASKHNPKEIMIEKYFTFIKLDENANIHLYRDGLYDLRKEFITEADAIAELEKAFGSTYLLPSYYHGDLAKIMMITKFRMKK
jgi:hypothetical protein